jgi:hypothetical protein
VGVEGAENLWLLVSWFPGSLINLKELGIADLKFQASPVGMIPAFSTMRMTARSGARVR